MRTLASWMTITVIAAAAVLGDVAGSDGRAQEAPPLNDDFANYTLVGLGLSPPGGGFEDIVQTGGATLEEGEPMCLTGGGATVWYVYYPQTTSPVTVDTTGSDFSTLVGVYRITDFAPSPPGGSLEQLYCAGATGGQATLEFPALTNHGGYAIQVGGVAGETGQLVVRIACSVGACPPANDEIASARVLYEMPFLEDIDTTAAGTEAGEPQPCGDIGKTVWYRFGTFETGGDTVSVYASSADFDPVIAIYKVNYSAAPSPPGALSELSCTYLPDEDFPGHTFTTDPFSEYYVQVGGANATGGQLSVLLSCSPAENTQEGCFFGSVSVDTGGDTDIPLPESTAGRGGTVAPPETGTGGYLPGAR